jgi:hypothetical protein
MRMIIILAMVVLWGMPIYGQVTMEDVDGYRKSGFSEAKILEFIKKRGGFELTDEARDFLAEKGFSGKFLGDLKNLGSKPKFPPLPENLKNSYQACPGAETEKIFALAIGVNSYKEQKVFPKLNCAVADAKSFVKHLLAIGVPPEQVCLLAEEQVTAAEMEKYVQVLLRVKGTAYLFYSGHGLYFARLGFCFSCYDTDSKKIAETSYPMSKLRSELEKMQSERLIVLLDACHSGGAKAPMLCEEDEQGKNVQDTVTLGQVSKEAQSKLKELAVRSKPVAVITACRENQWSREGTENGKFTEVLLQGFSGKTYNDGQMMAKPDGNSDGRVTTEEIWDYLNAVLPKVTGRAQMPDFSFSEAWGTEKGLPIPGKHAEAKPVEPQPKPEEKPIVTEPKPETKPPVAVAKPVETPAEPTTYDEEKFKREEESLGQQEASGKARLGELEQEIEEIKKKLAANPRDSQFVDALYAAKKQKKEGESKLLLVKEESGKLQGKKVAALQKWLTTEVAKYKEMAAEDESVKESLWQALLARCPAWWQAEKVPPHDTETLLLPDEERTYFQIAVKVLGADNKPRQEFCNGEKIEIQAAWKIASVTPGATEKVEIWRGRVLLAGISYDRKPQAGVYRQAFLLQFGENEVGQTTVALKVTIGKVSALKEVSFTLKPSPASLSWQGPDPGLVGTKASKSLKYKLCLYNSSSEPLQYLVVKAVLPAGMTYQQGKTDGKVLSWKFASLAPGEIKECVYELQPLSPGFFVTTGQLYVAGRLARETTVTTQVYEFVRPWLDQALTIAEKVEALDYKSEALRDIAVAMAKAGEKEQAKQMFLKAIAAAERIQLASTKFGAMAYIAREMAYERDFVKAVAIMEKIEEPNKSYARYCIAPELAKAGEFSQAVAMAEKIEKADQKSFILYRIANEMVKARAFTQAVSLTEKLAESDNKSYLLWAIVLEMAKAGDYLKAIAVAEKEQKADKKSSVLYYIALEMAKAGKSLQAIAVAEKIEDAVNRSAALLSVVTSLAKAGEKEQADRLLLKAMAAAEKIEKPVGKFHMLCYIAYMLIKSGDMEQAHQFLGKAMATVEKIEDARSKYYALRNAAVGLAATGDMEQASHFCRQAVAAAEQAKASLQLYDLSGMAADMSKAGEKEVADQFWRQAIAVAEKIAQASDKAKALWEIAAKMAQTGDKEQTNQCFGKAIAAAEKIARTDDQCKALCAIATQMARAGAREQANQCFAKAIAIAETTERADDKAGTLCNIATELAKSGDKEQANQVFLKAIAAAEKDKTASFYKLHKIASALAQAAVGSWWN